MDHGLAYNESVEAMRDGEYPMLKDATYLDHAGTTLYAHSLIDRFAREMKQTLLGNPHSASPSSQRSTSRVEDIRHRVLQFFHADPTEFDLVFVANATAGIKLVADTFRAMPGGFHYGYHVASHTSLVGVREEARKSSCLDDAAVQEWLETSIPPLHADDAHLATLFAYPAQSNMDGSRFPLSWSSQLRQTQSSHPGRVYTLLDAAALVSTSPLDLGDSSVAPDFVVLSLYKIFGFPDLGALLVRRQAEHVFDARRYFGGGTVDMVVCGEEEWHSRKTSSLHDRLEDGTLPIHSILALDCALDVHAELFGSMSSIAAHTSYLANHLAEGLMRLKHDNGDNVCTMYSRAHEAANEGRNHGPVLAFNLRTALGKLVSLTEIEKLAALKNFHIRTGSLCNPGGIARTLGLEPWELQHNFSSGIRCGEDNEHMSGKPTGLVRVSLGAMSTLEDVNRFVAFIDEFYRERASSLSTRGVPTTTQRPQPTLQVTNIVVYPIKSCGGFEVGPGQAWEIRPEGLAWDREWCLLHRGSGRALSQKQIPKMALLRPVLDFERGELRVTYRGASSSGGTSKEKICLPLGVDSSLLGGTSQNRLSRVCGEDIVAQVYTSSEINGFFSRNLGVPCVLARFPADGQGRSARHAKAHLQEHQSQSQMQARPSRPCRMLGSPPSPPDSDTEAATPRILLSNESPILLINMASVRAVNEAIQSAGGSAVSPSSFRANITVDTSMPTSDNEAFSEDDWSMLRIGQDLYKMLGACRRCQMVCINQETGTKSDDPFVTLSKMRRFDGKVFFGAHMTRLPRAPGEKSWIRTGQQVQVLAE